MPLSVKGSLMVQMQRSAAMHVYSSHLFACRSTLLTMCNAAQVDDAVLYPEAARGAFRITVCPHTIPTVAELPVMKKPAIYTAW